MTCPLNLASSLWPESSFLPLPTSLTRYAWTFAPGDSGEPGMDNKMHFWCKGVLSLRIVLPKLPSSHFVLPARVTKKAPLRTPSSRSWARMLHSTHFYHWRRHGTGSHSLLEAIGQHAERQREDGYPTVMGWLRCAISFSLLRSSPACLRESTKSGKDPTPTIHDVCEATASARL